MRKIIFLFFVFFNQIFAQNGDIQGHSDVAYFFDRLDILGRLDTGFISEVRPMPREYLTDLIRKADTSGFKKRNERWWLRVATAVDDSFASAYKTPKQIEKGRERRGFFSAFYPNSRDFLAIPKQAKGNPTARVFVNPILYFGAGMDNNDFPGNPSKSVYQNTRGASLRVTLLDKIGIYSEFADNQRRLPGFTNRADSNQTLMSGATWGEGFTKPFKTDGSDFLNGKAYITYSPWKFLRFKIGRDRSFWGQGRQSVFLNDFAVDSWLASFRLSFPKFDYHWQLSQFVDFIPNKPDSYGRYPAKYGVFHFLTFRPRKNISLSVFESVMYAAYQPNGYRGFEIQYLNPIIFYRTVEQFVGSPDNSFLGFSFKWNFLKHFRIYGQLCIDDYNFGNRKNGKGWWGNKIGLQGGLMWIDILGLETLDLMLEFNQASPYMFAHTNPAAAYTHYGQPLAHSLGANFREIYAKLSYQIIPALYISGDICIWQKGLDINGLNYGGNIYRTNLTHIQDYNNVLFQGNKFSSTQIHGKLSYQLFRTDIWADADLYMRKDGNYKSTVAMLGLRIGFNAPQWRF